MLTYLHGDHLGSASLATDASGTKITDSDTRYYPYGMTRPGLAGTGLPTDRRFTGQREETSLGLYDYGARPYAPALGRFISADSIIPGAASGSGGGAATLGYDSQTRLTPLTVNLGEFVAQINAENREILQFGAFFQWDARTRQEHNVPSGPSNPQALNRYAYCLNNPLRYVDPTGHSNVTIELTAEEARQLIDFLDNAGNWDFGLGLLGQVVGHAWGAIGMTYNFSKEGFTGLLTPASQELLRSAWPFLALAATPPVAAIAFLCGTISGVDSLVTGRDIGELQEALLATRAGEYGAKLLMKSTLGISRIAVETAYARQSFTTATIGVWGSALPPLLELAGLSRNWGYRDIYRAYLPYVAR